LISIKPKEEDMFRKLSVSVVAVVLLMLPAQLMAGGPPRLCLPINNVTSMSAADQCSKQIAEFFGKRVSGVTMQEHKGQWYATIALRQDVSLTAVHDALAASSFSVPREKLTLIGPARLSITVRTKFLEGFFNDLAKIEGLTIDDKSRDESGLLVTINQTNLCRDLDDATRKARPSYDSVKELLDDHNAELADVRWSGSWTCRGVFGCLVTPAASTKETVANK
jgi:hypothetical protein